MTDTVPIGAPPDDPEGGRTNPRNPWSIAAAALDLCATGAVADAERMVEQLRYHPEMPPGIFELYAHKIDLCRRQRGGAPVVNGPAEYLRLRHPRLRPPFRQIKAAAKLPAEYPQAMALPPIPGLVNDIRFLEDAATALADAPGDRIRRVHVVLAATDRTDPAAIAAALSCQRGALDLRLTLFSTALAPILPDDLAPEVIADRVLGAQAQQRLRRLVEREADLVIFLDGEVTLDGSFLDRVVHLARASDNVVQPLVPLDMTGRMRTMFSRPDAQGPFRSRHPFSGVQGLNLACSAALLRRVGLPDTRFAGTFLAAREIAFRMFMRGAYFAPVSVPRVRAADDRSAGDEDRRLFVALCPSGWDRSGDGPRERPRVSVCIATRNAGRFITRAVDSVLAQDVADLEVCIADDGSDDGTAEILANAYGGEPRVRWQGGRRGGIGHASNRAVALTRAPYIGQLASDEILKPGAVRRLAEHLDAHPELACCYGACERVDAAGRVVEKDGNGPVVSRESMMTTAIAHRFRMFRRAAWDRTAGFREDIVNAVDDDMLLKVGETGHVQLVDEVMSQRCRLGGMTAERDRCLRHQDIRRARREALKRLGLDRSWELQAPDPAHPRRVGYARRKNRRMVLFWPDYSEANPYLHLLYRRLREDREVCTGDIDAALGLLDQFEDPGLLTFHLHWLNPVLQGAADGVQARAIADVFLGKLAEFTRRGGRLVWTIHNAVSHDTEFDAVESAMSAGIAVLAHVLHLHSASSVAEIARKFELPRAKVRISRHGSYIGAYPDFVSRAAARRALGLTDADEVILFFGQIRSYKGIEHLIEVFRRFLADRPQALLLLAGWPRYDVLAAVTPALTAAERARIRLADRLIDDLEVQLFFRAADLAVFPYRQILTSGSLLLALSFGVPALVPSVGMTREVLESREAGFLYDPAIGSADLDRVLRDALGRRQGGGLARMSVNARQLAEALDWPDFASVLEDGPETARDGGDVRLAHGSS